LARIAEDHRTAGITTLHPNPWNVNVMEGEAFRALKESVEELGFVEPPVVRRHPKKPRNWQIIGGEHRWKAAKELGMVKIPIVVLDLDDEQARKAVLMLNNRGRAEHLALARELAALYELFGEETTRGLPLTPDQLKEMVALAEAKRPELSDGELPGKPGEANFVTIVFHVAQDAVTVIEGAVERAMEEGESASRGVALERICADFLATPPVKQSARAR
jgi:hypothetical protein